MPMRLSAQTTTSTICASPSLLSSVSGSDPGRGILSHISAATTNGFVEMRSKESTTSPLGSKDRASAASPHPRSATTVFDAAEDSTSIYFSTGFVGHDCTW